jgi:spore coat polysaccharide biosynthesis protein SpsF
MYQNKQDDIKIIQFSSDLNRYHYRLTVDTPEDFELIRRLIEDYGCESKSINEITDVLDNHPELVEINRAVTQKTWRT